MLEWYLTVRQNLSDGHNVTLTGRKCFFMLRKNPTADKIQVSQMFQFFGQNVTSARGISRVTRTAHGMF